MSDTFPTEDDWAKDGQPQCDHGNSASGRRCRRAPGHDGWHDDGCQWGPYWMTGDSDDCLVDDDETATKGEKG